MEAAVMLPWEQKSWLFKSGSSNHAPQGAKIMTLHEWEQQPCSLESKNHDFLWVGVTAMLLKKQKLWLSISGRNSYSPLETKIIIHGSSSHAPQGVEIMLSKSGSSSHALYGIEIVFYQVRGLEFIHPLSRGYLNKS